MQIDKPAIKRQFLKCRLLQCIFGCFLGCSLFSCGKPIKESDNSQVTRTPGATASSELISNIDGERNHYEFREYGKVFIPPHLNYIRGKRAPILKLIFAQESEDPFYCDYRDGGLEDEYEFVQCHSYEEDDGPNKDCATCLGYKPGAEGPILIMEPSEKIKLQSSETKVDVEIEIDWF